MFLNRLCRCAAFAVLFALAGPAQLANAQSSTPRTLLWRISGKGLTAPSYLFGTIHLSDKRLFDFGDSVYRAIENTEGLAIELNPDEMAAYAINQQVDRLQWTDDDADSEPPRDDAFDKYREALARKLNKPAIQITRRDLVRWKHRWVDDYVAKGEMPTFVDAYLYNIARRQGKWVGGIEDLTDQMGIAADVIDQADIDLMADRVVNGRSMVEEMIALYVAQDLDGIERRVASADSGNIAETYRLNRRNVKMARRMDSLSAQRTMFFAVGAAHLPGDSGVIQLLRVRGFTVSPVVSIGKLAASRYVFTEVPAPWYDVADTVNRYTVQMPGNPAALRLYGVVDMKFLFDISNMASFCTMSVVSVDPQKTDAELLDGVAAGIFKSQKAPRYKTISQNGISGREYTHIVGAYPVRLRAFSHERVVYLAMVYGRRKTILTGPDANRFFSSFRIDKAAPATARLAPVQIFADSTSAVRLVTQATLSPFKIPLDADAAESYDLRSWAGIDRAAGAYVMLVVQSTREGYHIVNDSAALDENYDALAGGYDALQSAPLRFEGRRALMMHGRSDETALRALMFMRGNRRYLLMALGDSAVLAGPRVSEMFSGLSVLPYRAAMLGPAGDSGRNFSSTAPSPFHAADAAAFATAFTAFDSNTSTTYTVSADTLGPYTWYEGDSAAWTAQLAGYSAPDHDTIVAVAATVNGADASREWLIRKKGAATHARLRVVRHGRVLYSLFASADAEVLAGETANHFFNDFKVLTAAKPFDWTKPRQAELLTAIGSSDSATRSTAIAALRSADFTAKDLPLLHPAFLHSYASPYSDNDTTDGVNAIIGSHLARLAHPSTLEFLEKEYPRITGSDSFKRHAAMIVLAQTKTEPSYRLLVSLLANHPTAGSLDYDVGYYLIDSLTLLHGVYPQLRSLASDSVVGTTAAFATLRLVDSGLVNLSELQAAGSDFAAHAGYVAQQLRADSNAAIPYASDLIRLLGRLGTPGPLAALRAFYVLPHHRYLSLLALTEAIRAGVPADTAALTNIAADATLRLPLYRKLVEMDRRTLYPKVYATQRHFAEGLVHESAEYDDEALTGLEFVEMRTVATEAGSRRFYLFKALLADADGTGKPYLAVAGGFAKDARAVLPDDGKTMSGIYYVEAFNERKLDVLFSSFLRQMLEEEG